MSIINGYVDDNSEVVEIVDLNSTTSSCSNLQNYPAVVRGSVGGILDGSTPLICGGTGSSSCNQYKSGQWQSTFSTNTGYFHFAGMPSSPFQNASHKFYVVGGKTSEVLTDSGWKVVGPPLPKTIYVPCLVKVDATTILVVAGTTDTFTPTEVTYSRETFIFSGQSNDWKSGPKLNVGRRGMGCGILPDNAGSSKMNFIVAGGQNADGTVELLDNIQNNWRLGTTKIRKSPRTISIHYDKKGLDTITKRYGVTPQMVNDENPLQQKFNLWWAFKLT